MGKKVFFLYPHSVIQNEMVQELVKNEFEIYLIPDHAKVLKLFLAYPDSIVFINIDEGMKEPDWEKFIADVQKTPELSDLRIGILTYNNNAELAKKYLMDLMVPCGFIKLSLGLKESTDIVLKVLEANEARGRRKFLRVKCPQGAAVFNYREKEAMISGNILDVSSVGMACIFEKDRIYTARTYLSDLQLKLKGVLCMVSAIVMGTRSDETGKLIYILLFDYKEHPESKQKIRIFMQQNLQFVIDQEIKVLPQ